MTQGASGKELAEIISQARPQHPFVKWLCIALVCIGIGFGIRYYLQNSDPETGPIYNTENLTRGDLSLTITATGNLAPTNQVTVGSELSGTVSNVYVDTNDLVKKGQPIAELDTSKLAQQTERNRAVLLAAKARVSQAQATIAETSASLERFKDLHRISGGKTPSRADMDAAIASVERSKADVESANAAVAQSEADLKSIERDLAKAIIRSPVDGIILSRTIEVGQTVAASFTAPILFVIAEDLRKMDLVVAVAEADIGRLENGQQASFTVDAWPSRTYNAAVKRVSYGSITTNNIVTYNTELEVANDDLSLRPGMTATAEVAVAKRENVLLIPNAALRFDPVAAEALGKAEEPKKTLVQSLSPGGRRWGSRTPTPLPAPRSKEPRVWTLKNGEPVEILITVGLTDGRFTEASGEGLEEGIPIIVTAKPAVKP